MRLILSRKGFDSSAGGGPSPILPDGRLVSLPIPAPSSKTYAEVCFAGTPLSNILAELAPNRDFSSEPCHLDPDLREGSLVRAPGWRPMFGQVGAAQSHLERNGVSPRDLFLFFGWFRQTEQTPVGLRFQRGAPDLHVLFGWLQIERIHSKPEFLQAVPWACDHPHVDPRVNSDWSKNTVYEAAPDLRTGHESQCRAGGGIFSAYSDALRLTAPGEKRTVWWLPRWFHPEGRQSVLSCHSNPTRWEAHTRYTLLRSVARGQEFVLDIEHYPEAIAWLSELFAEAA